MTLINFRLDLIWALFNSTNRLVVAAKSRIKRKHKCIHNFLRVQPGSSDTGYGQICASTDSQAQLPATNSNLQEHSNFTTSSGYMGASQVSVQPGQQFGTQSMSGVVPQAQRGGFQLQQEVEGTASSTDGGAQVAYDSCKFFLMASVYM